MINPAAIQIVPTVKPGGYNPSVIEHNGRTFMSYRFHPKADHWRTCMAIEMDGKTLPLNPPKEYAQHSLEDGRFFVREGKLHLSVTVSRSRVSGQACDPCIIAYGQIVKEPEAWRFLTWIEPKHPNNVWSKQTKNVNFFEA